MNNKYKAMDIANYIIWYANDEKNGLSKYSLTPLKLQKILYYISAAYLRKTNEVLFGESFSKWQYGPVAPTVYHNFKSFGINHLDKPISTIEVDPSSIFGFKKSEFKSCIFNEDRIFREIADYHVDKLIKISAFDLVELTHKEDAWRDFEPLIKKGVKDLQYTKEELLQAKEF